MVRILDWKRSEDPRDIVHVVVQALAEGELVLLPTETTYYVAASALHAEAVQRMMSFPGRDAERPPSLFLRSADELADFAPNLSRVGRRVAHRGWPGPVAIELAAEPDQSLCGRLPESVRGAICGDSCWACFQVAAHQAVADTLQLIPGPIVGASVRRPEGGPLCEPQLDAAQREAGVGLIVDDGPTHFGGLATHLRIDGNNCEITAEGVVNQSVLHSLGQLVILLVCTGNTCRSPMAETLMRDRLHKRFPELFRDGQPPPAMTISAGLSAYPGGAASPEAVTVMSQRGLSLKDHQSRPVTERLLKQADLVLTMTASHRHAIVQRWPEVAGKTFLLSPEGRDVADPYGGAGPIYAACAEEMESYISPWVSQIDDTWLPHWKS
jgi:protein-tyrosine-phosphatase/tRNA A37 threonylcarbamoyladenosine synthetase subunit TsaC/SUA5/YrdC